MPANSSRKFKETIDFIDDMVGADVPRDVLKATIENSAGANIDPATTALEELLQGNAGDEGRVRVFGLDAGGTLQAVNAEAFDATLAVTDVGVATYGASALHRIAEDEYRVRAFGPDAGGTIQQVNAEQFGVALATTDVGLATYGDRALQSLAQDELRSRVHDSTGTQIDPATTALENALQANAADEYRIRVFGLDAGGALQHVNAEQFSVALATTDVGIATYGDRALNSLGQDELRSRLHDSTGTQINPATTALENALQGNAVDEYRVRLFGPDAGAVLQAINAEQFDTALAASDVGVATYGDRALASLAQDEWIARTADSTGAQQDLQQTDSAFHNGTAIAAGGADSTGLAAPGASKLRGRVVNDAQYDLDIEVLDAPGGTVLFTVNVATDVAAGTETALDENLESPFINVVVTNDGGAQSSMTAAYHLVGGN